MTKTLDASSWNGQSLASTGCGPATESTGWTTFGQVTDMLAGVSTASVNNVTQWTFAGTGAATSFDLTSAPQGLADAKELIVYINNVPQIPDVGYGVDTTDPLLPAITFDTAPDNLDVIYVRAVSGTVSTTFNDSSVTNSAIADKAIDIDHLFFGSGDPLRFITVDANGDAAVRQAAYGDITNFATGVVLSRLDEMAAPTAPLAMNAQQITGLAAGSLDTDGVTKLQMELAIAAVTAKSSHAVVLGPIAAGVTVTVADIGFVPTNFVGTRANSSTHPLFSFNDVNTEITTTPFAPATSTIEFTITGGDSKTVTVKNTHGSEPHYIAGHFIKNG